MCCCQRNSALHFTGGVSLCKSLSVNSNNIRLLEQETMQMSWNISLSFLSVNSDLKQWRVAGPGVHERVETQHRTDRARFKTRGDFMSHSPDIMAVG